MCLHQRLAWRRMLLIQEKVKNSKTEGVIFAIEELGKVLKCFSVEVRGKEKLPSTHKKQGQ
jgi:hypothetical protein